MTEQIKFAIELEVLYLLIIFTVGILLIYLMEVE